MWKTTLIAVSIVAVASLSPAQDSIFADDFEWGSICAWSNLWYEDSDGDGWGATGTTGIPVSCPPPGGYAPNQGDCDPINPLINPGEPELCDFIDNDCNPVTTDGAGELWFADPCDGLDSDLCDEGAFECTNAVQVCSDESDDNIELCNTIDDDCNAVTTDGAGELWFGDPCDGIDSDLCEDGFFACVGGSQSCNDETDDHLDICDGFDNDCNPVTPDGSGEPWIGDPCDGPDTDLCDEGVSSCVSGSQICSDNTDDLLDICDGFDNDCDPTSADGSEDPLYGAGCDTGVPGICAAGVTECTGGALACDQTGFPTGEICDGLDNDCDDATDEGNPGGGIACDTGMPGVCAAGMTECTGGALACDQTGFPTGEICDGLDNDCDDTTDEGNPGGGAPCDTGMLGVCSPGLTHCTGGALTCEQQISPSAEICDGLDNDCDGVPDEGNPGGGTACDTGMPGICSSGTTLCTGGALACEQDTPPTGEICDGLDNDCDGVPDEGNPGGGAACDTGMLGVCAQGTTTCLSGSLQCVQDVAPSAEVCDDFIDNDCDGDVDCDDASCDSDPWCE